MSSPQFPSNRPWEPPPEAPGNHSNSQPKQPPLSPMPTSRSPQTGWPPPGPTPTPGAQPYPDNPYAAQPIRDQDTARPTPYPQQIPSQGPPWSGVPEGWTPPPPPKRSGGGLKWLLVFGGVFVLGGLVATWFLLGRGSQETPNTLPKASVITFRASPSPTEPTSPTPEPVPPPTLTVTGFGDRGPVGLTKGAPRIVELGQPGSVIAGFVGENYVLLYGPPAGTESLFQLFDVQTEDLIWEANLPVAGRTTVVASPSAKFLYLHSCNSPAATCTDLLVSAATGEVISSIDSARHSAAIFDDNDTLYRFSPSDWTITAFAQDGSQLWQQPTSHFDLASAEENRETVFARRQGEYVTLCIEPDVEHAEDDWLAKYPTYMNDFRGACATAYNLGDGAIPAWSPPVGADVYHHWFASGANFFAVSNEEQTSYYDGSGNEQHPELTENSWVSFVRHRFAEFRSGEEPDTEVFVLKDPLTGQDQSPAMTLLPYEVLIAFGDSVAGFKIEEGARLRSFNIDTGAAEQVWELPDDSVYIAGQQVFLVCSPSDSGTKVSAYQHRHDGPLWELDVPAKLLGHGERPFLAFHSDTGVRLLVGD